MSSTNRSKVRDVHIADYYITPIEKIMDFLNEFVKYEPDAFDGEILDPCAGGDLNNPMSYPEALIKFGIDKNKIYTIDIRNDSKAEIKADYLTYQLDFRPKVIITNPPFIIAQEIIEKALSDVDDNGFVIMLLRLNYFGGKKRKKFWDENMPKYVFVHNRRMSFTEDGKTDSIEYMHAVWQKGYRSKFTQLRVI